MATNPPTGKLKKLWSQYTTAERIMQMTVIGTLNMDRLLEALSVILSNREGAEVKVGLKKE